MNENVFTGVPMISPQEYQQALFGVGILIFILIAAKAWGDK